MSQIPFRSLIPFNGQIKNVLYLGAGQSFKLCRINPILIKCFILLELNLWSNFQNVFGWAGEINVFKHALGMFN